MLKKLCFHFLSSITFLLLASNLFALPVEGSISGTFTNPEGPAGMVTSGEDTTFFSWGTSINNNSPSWLSFTGTSFSGETNEIFSFGTLEYYNGAIVSGTEADSVDLDIILNLTTPTGPNQIFIYILDLINTPNTGSLDDQADYVNFSNTIPLSYFTVDNVNYTLEFIGFGEIIDGGFFTPDAFHVYEGTGATAQLLGRFTEQPSTTNPVPEPTTMVLLASGLIGLFFKKKKQ